MGRRGTPTCVWRVDVDLVERLDRYLGPPLDSYVRGWQVWLEPHGPAGERLEWRLHPPARFVMPHGVDPHDLFEVVLAGVAAGAGALERFPAGQERRALAEVWEALEAFPVHGEAIDPGTLARATGARLGGRLPAAAGWADHDRLGDLWKGRRGDFSVGQALLEALPPLPPAAADPRPPP